MKPETQTKTELAASLGVSRSSLYYKHKMPDKDLALKVLIEKTWYEDEFPEYGQRRLAIHLGIGKKRIKRVMNAYKMKPPKRRTKKPAKPKDQNQPEAPFPNIIKTLCPIRPGVVWSSDFTYIPWREGFIYLATVMDIFNREIIGWHILSVHTVALIEGAFSDALSRCDILPAYFHSDQGSEYKELKHLENVQQRGIIVSMSKKASPWENGCQESYYSNFKLELGDSNRFETLGELIVEIHRLINRYNNQRIHTSLGCSPIQFKEIYYKKHSARVMQSVS